MALPQRTVTFAVAACVVLVTVVGTMVRNRDALDSPDRLLLTWALIAVGCSALLWRRRWRVPVAVVTLLCCAAYFPMSPVDLPVLLLAFACALYTVAAQGHLTAAITLAFVTLLSTVYVEQVVTRGERHVDDAAIFLMAGWFVGVIAIGQAQRTHRAYLREVEQRVRAAEREKDVRAQQSATEERLRIARELHDVLGHNISLINVQAGAALHRHSKRPRGPEELVPALEAIRDSSKVALRELRATLGVLRQVDDGEGAPVTPTAGIERIEELTARARAAGLDVRTTVEDAAHGLPPQVSLAAYRIVQESLTNVSRHARAHTAAVTVHDRTCTGTGRRTDRPRHRKRLPRRGPYPGRGRRVIRVVLADDQTLVRAGFRSILDDEDDIEVVGEAANGNQALALARELRPDVVLMDIRMPELDGLEATRRIVSDPSFDGVRVVILTTFDVDDYATAHCARARRASW